MFARSSTWTGTPQALHKWAGHVTSRGRADGRRSARRRRAVLSAGQAGMISDVEGIRAYYVLSKISP